MGWDKPLGRIRTRIPTIGPYHPTRKGWHRRPWWMFWRPAWRFWNALQYGWIYETTEERARNFLKEKFCDSVDPKDIHPNHQGPNYIA